MKKAYAVVYNEDSFEGISVPFELKETLEFLRDQGEELITDVFDNYESYRDEEVDMAHYAKDGSDGTYDISSAMELRGWFISRFKRKIQKDRISENILNKINNLEEIPISPILSDDEARIILEDVIDTLIEVGNGTTDEQLHKAADKLLNFRDNWLDKVL